MTSRLRDRPTSDLVVLVLAMVVGVVVLVGVVGVVISITFTHDDVSDFAIRIAAITNTMVGAIIGYIGGRSTREVVRNGNGQS